MDLTQQKKEAVNLKSGQNKFKLKHRGKKHWKIRNEASVTYSITSTTLQTYSWNPRQKDEGCKNTKKTTTRHIMLIETSDKENYLKSIQKKQGRCVTWRDTIIRLMADFLLEILQVMIATCEQRTCRRRGEANSAALWAKACPMPWKGKTLQRARLGEGMLKWPQGRVEVRKVGAPVQIMWVHKDHRKDSGFDGIRWESIWEHISWWDFAFKNVYHFGCFVEKRL